MANILGLDIGGANTKAAFLRTQNGSVVEFKTALEYFPFWKHNSNQLPELFMDLKNRVAGFAQLDCISVTLTAELSDAYQTKRQGVADILNQVNRAFEGLPVLVLDVNSNLRSVDSALAEPLAVAAANWAATGWMVSQRIRNCVIVDVGSTSTSIIPILDAKIAAKGKTDLAKLINGELIYSGSLRTNVAAIVSLIPINGNITRVSSELFAQSGDVHLILGHITEKEYTAETADGRGKTRSEALARLARVVCADTDTLKEPEIVQIARYVSEKQIEQIADGLAQVYMRLKPSDRTIIPTIVTGVGKDFLAKAAAQKNGIEKILTLDELAPFGVSLTSPAAGVALMAATKLEGRSISWTQ